MQHKAVYLVFCMFTLYVSDVNHTHQEYKNCVTTASGICATWPRLATLEGGSCTNTGGCSYTVLCTPDDGCG